MSGPDSGTLYYGDCLDWMSEWDNQTVDLIYLDPPFNSKADYNVLYSSEGGADAQYRAFTDTWAWDDKAADRFAAYEGAPGRRAHDTIVGLRRALGPSGMLAYLTYMAERLEQMHRLLKPTGSIYLHCDPTASHYLKTLMDAIFGAVNFRNEIVWKRTHVHGGSGRWGGVHDTILLYAKNADKCVWTGLTQKYEPEYVSERYDKADKRGSYQEIVMTGAGTSSGPSGEPWQGYDPSAAGRHWAVPRAAIAALRAEGIAIPDDLHARLDLLLEHEFIRIPLKRNGAKGVPRFKRYLESTSGLPIQDLISDIPPLNSQAKERLGYPTQKPVALLERIVRASSNEGDVVLDPFCGCGTTIEAARNLNRRWAGIDISSFAIDLIAERRLKDAPFSTKGIPTDLASARKLAREQPFNFEAWAVMRLPGFAPNTKQVGDGGVDGRAVLAIKPDNFDSRLALAQVKGGKFNLGTLRDFIHVTRRDKAALGCYVTLDPVNTPASKVEIADIGKISVAGYQYPRMQVWPIADYFDQRMPNMPIMNDPYSGKPMTQGLLF